MPQLNRKHTGHTKTLPLKIMQFGGGNFLRAFTDWMIQILNEETAFKAGVAIVKPTAYGDYQELKKQDGLFTVVLDGLKDGEFIQERKMVTAVQQVINCYKEWPEYLELARSADLRFIISNTTEAGIKFNPEDLLTDEPPIEFPAKLTLWLHHRFLHFKGDPSKGCIILPCELIEDNGEALHAAVLQYANHWKLGSAFTNWINNANYFCNTLVDRIVSGYPGDRAKSIADVLGYKDALMVAGEYYHSWIIQGASIVEKEMPFSETGLNVAFVNDLAPYREMKVRILNGAHTAMVPVGYLAGIRTVKEAMEAPLISHYIEMLLQKEIAITLKSPDSVKQKFISDVLDRFRNPILKHQLISIALNATSKFVTRLLPSLKAYFDSRAALPERIVFALSALILFYKGAYKGEPIALKDDEKVLEFFAEQWKQYVSENISLQEMVLEILKNSSIWSEDLSTYKELVLQVSEHIRNIETLGIEKSLSLINKGNLSA